MTTDTSKKSWDEFKNTDARAHCMKLIMEVLSKGDPLTGREICERAAQEGLWKRLSELEKIGAIETCGKRRCSITGRTSYIWKVKIVEEPKSLSVADVIGS